MNGLRGFSGTDGDHLRQMEMEAGRLGKDSADRAQHQLVHDEVATGWRTGDEPARTTRLAPGELVGSERSRLEIRRQLGANQIENRRCHQPLHDGAAHL
jgi:hypothetical protein